MAKIKFDFKKVAKEQIEDPTTESESEVIDDIEEVSDIEIVGLGGEITEVEVEYDKSVENVQSTITEIKKAEHEIAVLESISEAIEVVAPVEKSENGEVVVNEMGDEVKNLHAEMPVEHRILLTAASGLIGENVEPQEALGEVALATDEEGVVTNESLNSITYKAAMEGLATVIGNFKRTVESVLKNVFNKLADVMSNIVKITPILDKRIRNIKEKVDKYIADGYVLKSEGTTYPIKDKLMYSIGRDSIVKNTDELFKYLKYSKAIVDGANNDKEDAFIKQILKLAEDGFKVTVDLYKSISGKNAKNLLNWANIDSSLKKQIIDEFNKIANALISINVKSITDVKNSNNAEDSIKIEQCSIKIKTLTLGGYFSGYEIPDSDFYNKSKNNHAKNIAAIKKKLSYSATIDEVNAFKVMIEDELVLICVLLNLKSGLLDHNYVTTTSFKTMSLQDISKACSMLLDLSSSMKQFRNGSYIKTRDSALKEAKRVNEELGKYIDDNVKNIPINWVVSLLLKSIVSFISDEFHVPFTQGRFTIRSATSILSKNLSMYQKP